MGNTSRPLGLTRTSEAERIPRRLGSARRRRCVPDPPTRRRALGTGSRTAVRRGPRRVRGASAWAPGAGSGVAPGPPTRLRRDPARSREAAGTAIVKRLVQSVPTGAAGLHWCSRAGIHCSPPTRTPSAELMRRAFCLVRRLSAATPQPRVPDPCRLPPVHSRQEDVNGRLRLAGSTCPTFPAAAATCPLSPL
jgi:hypothetical protein